MTREKVPLEGGVVAIIAHMSLPRILRLFGSRSSFHFGFIIFFFKVGLCIK